MSIIAIKFLENDIIERLINRLKQNGFIFIRLDHGDKIFNFGLFENSQPFFVKKLKRLIHKSNRNTLIIKLENEELYIDFVLGNGIDVIQDHSYDVILNNIIDKVLFKYQKFNKG